MNDDKPLPKRFYKDATAAPHAGVWRIMLDGRPVRTPAKRELVAADAALAASVAAEWQSQGERIDPGSMPLTKLLNTAIDGVAGREAEVAADIVSYAGNDLICYFAVAPDDLVERQAQRWGAVHTWAEQAFGIRLVLAEGVMPVAQDPAMLKKVEALLADCNALTLAGLHVVTTLTGSTLLALAVHHDRLSPAEAWALAHLDEDFQIENWGQDAEATSRRARRWVEMQAACLALGKA